ncbi:hypothetical protein [Uliginosibacterium sediminicola]|uniref:Uncharacterized protein n=1 Tax=Uliginosibacterium sediminicola TaxID=2024550 RepID=A0ABU9Z102_9RHOO
MAAADAICTGTCNTTPQSVVQGLVKPDPLYFLNPATGEILECPPENVADIRQEAELLSKLADDLLRSGEQVYAATQALQVAEASADAAQKHESQKALEQATAAQERAREAMFKEFKDLPKFNDGASGLMELLPLATSKGQKLSKTRRVTFLRSDKVKNKTRTYHNLPGDATKLKSFYTKDESGAYKLDAKKLGDAFRSVPLKGKLTEADLFKSWAAGWAPEFVEAFNAKYDAKAAKDKADKDTPDEACLQFSGGASLLRFFAGVGGTASSELSTESFKKLLQGRGEIGAKFTGSARAGVDLASAQGDLSLYLPAKKGLHLHVAAGKNAKGGKQELELGYVRLLITGEVSATCGASVLAEGGLEFKLKADMTQGVKGVPAKKTAAAVANPKARVDSKVEAEVGGKAELSAFAGAEAGGKIGGAVEWQKEKSTEFKPFAKINAEGKGQAGIGGAAMFEIGYTDGKFRIKMKLGACVGLGLKGSIDAEIGVEHIVEFDLWFKHQVVNALDQNLKYFGDRAWKAFVYMKALAIAEGKKLSAYLGREVDELIEAWKNLVNTASKEVLNRIKASKDYVLTSVAEAKALLLGLLEQMKQDFQELRKDIEDLSRWLFSAAQTTQEADNITSRIATTMDTRVDQNAGRMRLAALAGGVDAINSVLVALKSVPTPGYELAFADDPAYRFSNGMGTHIAWQRSGFGNNNNRIV